MGILCDGIPIVFFQRYAVARNPVHHHMGPGTIVMGNFIFFLLEVIIERKVGVKRSYYIKNRHWLFAVCNEAFKRGLCKRTGDPEG